MARVAVIFGGPSPEHDVSVLTGLQATRALAGNHDVTAIYWTKSGAWCSVDPTLEASAFVDGQPKGAEPLRLVIGPDGGFETIGGRLAKARAVLFDVAVLCTHGGPGEDGTLAGTLDLAGISYVGPSVAGANLGMDKLAFAEVMAKGGLPTLDRVALLATTTELPFDGPVIVKPRFGGSSIGIEVVPDLATAKARLGANVHLAHGAICEPYRPDLEDLQIAVRTYPDLQLSAIERPLRAHGGGEILDYRDKYVGGEGMASAPRELPAQLPAGKGAAIEAAARRVCALALVRSVARIDFLSSDDELYVNEINTIPGSLARYLWITPSLSFPSLLNDLISEAQQRPTHRYSAAGADGLVLRGASSIAAKLA